MDTTNIKEGSLVTCKLVTGEIAIGFFGSVSPLTGSFLINDVITEQGFKGDYAFASEIIQEGSQGFNFNLH